MTTDRLAELDWDLIPYTSHSAHMHMAVDEVLLQRVIAGIRRPTVRFWEWIEPALVIGSHQSVPNEVDVVAAQELGFIVGALCIATLLSFVLTPALLFLRRLKVPRVVGVAIVSTSLRLSVNGPHGCARASSTATLQLSGKGGCERATGANAPSPREVRRSMFSV